MEIWKLITNIILILSILTLGVFVVLGLIQWIKRKSLKKVDKGLLWLPLPLALMALTYVVFDKLLPKFFDFMPTRPNGSGEPSFPSTHVMIAATIFFCVAIILPRYIKSKVALILLYLVMLAALVLMCMGRVLADMHWVSDVLSAVGFALIFAFIYYLIIRRPAKNG